MNRTNSVLLCGVLGLSSIASATTMDDEFAGAYDGDGLAGAFSVVTEINLSTNHSDDGFTDEFGVDRRYNEDNELKSFGLRKGNWVFGYSTFDNSYFDQSEMISLERDALYIGSVDISIGVALVNGYKKEIIRDHTFFISDDLMWAPMVSFVYRPDWLSFKGLSAAPKFRMMGLDSYMVNMELAYSFD